MQPLTHWSEELLRCGDAGMPDELYDRIFALGERARPRLLEFATDPAYRGPGSAGGGFAAMHALEILAAMPADDDTVAQLVASIAADPHAVDVDDLEECLITMGSAATNRVIAALRETDDPVAAKAYCEVLSYSEPRSEETFQALLGAFSRFGGEVALSLGEYGDARALPAMREAFAKHFVGAGTSEDSDEDALCIAQAMENLGARLTPEEERKNDLALRRQERRLAREELEQAGDEPDADEFDEAPAKPLPNDPCPCGSGRKFKKCHEGDPDFTPPDAP
jgi:hypothetical protein